MCTKLSLKRISHQDSLWVWGLSRRRAGLRWQRACGSWSACAATSSNPWGGSGCRGPWRWARAPRSRSPATCPSSRCCSTTPSCWPARQSTSCRSPCARSRGARPTFCRRWLWCARGCTAWCRRWSCRAPRCWPWRPGAASRSAGSRRRPPRQTWWCSRVSGQGCPSAPSCYWCSPRDLGRAQLSRGTWAGAGTWHTPPSMLLNVHPPTCQLRAAWQTCSWLCLSSVVLGSGPQVGEQAHCLCSLAHSTWGNRHMLTHKAQCSGEHRRGWTEPAWGQTGLLSSNLDWVQTRESRWKESLWHQSWAYLFPNQRPVVALSACFSKENGMFLYHQWPEQLKSTVLFHVTTRLWLQAQRPFSLSQAIHLGWEKCCKRLWMLQSRQRLESSALCTRAKLC